MKPELHQRAKELFLAALEVAESEREAWIERACDGDAPLAREVRALVEHHDAETREFEGLFEQAVALGRDALRARFAAGTLIGGRYRIVRRLGAGGMGEVYLAQDERLGERVALKFLPRRLARDPAWLARLVAEARVARGITHPGVCRVHDIGEADGEPFLTMEFVEGEDLATWLRRAGPIEPARVREMARELCAALGALHQQGVLHRDLKPSNVLVGRDGRMRLLDFGLAASLEVREADERRVEAGSPAYMAPELLRGVAPSVQSDLFSLGLVLFELAARRRAFVHPGEIARSADRREPPPSPGADADPVLERVVSRCLEPDPARRPDSALRLEAALAERDLLAGVLELGELPSPSVVAASGAQGLLGRRRALLGFALLIALLAAYVPLASHALPVQRAAPPLAPASLAPRVERLADELAPAPTTRARAFGYGGEELLELGRPDSGAWRLAGALDGDTELRFWWRGGEEALIPRLVSSFLYGAGRVGVMDPPLDEPGTRTLVVDLAGRLLFACRNPLVPPAPGPSVERETWPRFFERAGLDPGDFAPAAGVLPIASVGDRRVAWESQAESGPTAGLRVEAASLAGEPVLFALLRRDESADGAWGEESRADLSARIYDALLFIVLLFSIPVGWRNLRSGRGDPWGALRLALVTVLLRICAFALRASHQSDVSDELTLWIAGVGSALFDALTAWVVYMAVEPLVRRDWPRVLVGWSRALQGRLADPLVGSHVLIGACVGVYLAIVLALDAVLTSLLTSAEPGGVPGYAIITLAGPTSWIAALSRESVSALTNALVMLALLVVARIVLRRGTAALCVAACWIAAVDVLATPVPGISWVTLGLGQIAVGYLVLVRYGVLAYSVALFVEYVLEDFPTTLELGAWYGGSALFALAFVVALAAAACAAAARRPRASLQLGSSSSR